MGREPAQPSRISRLAFEMMKRYSLLLFPLSPSPTFIGRLHTPHTPRFDFRGMEAVRLAPGGGPYTAMKQA